MTDDVLDKASKLLALAGSPEKHEASLAAVMLVKHVVKHGLEFCHGNSVAEHKPSKKSKSKSTESDLEFVKMQSRYHSTCHLCSRHIFPGEWIKWYPTTRRATHSNCKDKRS